MATDVELEKMQREDHDMLVRLEGKFDTFIALQGSQAIEINDHEGRLRTVEKENTDLRGTLTGVRWILGAVAAVAGIIEPIAIFYLSGGGK